MLKQQGGILQIDCDLFVDANSSSRRSPIYKFMESEIKKGIESLRADVLRDANSEPKFSRNKNHNGAEDCPCAYCRHFRWALDRAAYYAEKLGTTVEAVMEAWETDRSYWYMNYYQDSNQPLIEGDDVRVFDTPEDFRKAVTKEFRCPRCGKVSTDPQECTQTDCDWKAYGLLRTLGKGVTVLSRNPIAKVHIFMPVAWEQVEGAA